MPNVNLPDRHGLHAHCTECGWDGPSGMSRSGAVRAYVEHQKKKHPEGTTQIGTTRDDKPKLYPATGTGHSHGGYQ